MDNLNRETFGGTCHPERILQIGEGNFLRCFIDWQIDILNETKGLDAGVVVARPIDSDQPPSLNSQDGLYTTVLRGYDEDGQLHNDKRIITCVTRELSIYREYADFLALARNPKLRFIVSNTTEAGIAYNDQDRFSDAPPASYPAKLTRFLYERFVHFRGARDTGFIILPCELIDDNGDKLKEIVRRYIRLWNLSDDFLDWIDQSNTFCSTLVDRIVTGYPHTEADALEEEFGYRDRFMVTGEYFHLFVIKGPAFVKDELKLADSGLNIEIVDDLRPYKQRKVGILNGSHTALVPVAYLSGIELVKDAVAEPQLANYLQRLLDEEIIPSLGMPVDYLKEFAASVIGRFKNPFIDHRLLDISLNSMTKFKTRLLPQFLSYCQQNQAVPPLMTLSLAALICFYRGKVDGNGYPLKDDQPFLELYAKLWGEAGMNAVDKVTARDIASQVLGLEQHWETDLFAIDGLLEQVTDNIVNITSKGMRTTLEEVL